MQMTANDLRTGGVAWLVLAAIVGGCGGGAASSTLPSGSGSTLEEALAAAEVPVERDRTEQPQVLSATFSGGCVIPCGESGVGGPIVVLTPTDDPTYGYTQANPIRVRGIAGYHEDRYMRALWGPEGQPIRFERIGSCCPMEDGGLLDAIAVSYDGLSESVVLYLDAYHEGALYIPVGFSGATLDPSAGGAP